MIIASRDGRRTPGLILCLSRVCSCSHVLISTGMIDPYTCSATKEDGDDHSELWSTAKGKCMYVGEKDLELLNNIYVYVVINVACFFCNDSGALVKACTALAATNCTQCLRRCSTYSPPPAALLNIHGKNVKICTYVIYSLQI